MNWEEAVHIILQQEGLSKLPIPGATNPTRYEISQQAWKIYIAAGGDPRKISFRAPAPLPLQKGSTIENSGSTTEKKAISNPQPTNQSHFDIQSGSAKVEAQAGGKTS